MENKTTVEKRLKTLISTKLQEIREAAGGQSLEKMAEQLNLNYTVLFHIYSGKYLPRLTTLTQILDFYNLPIEIFFKDLTNKDKATLAKNASHATLISDFDKLDKPMQASILKIVRKLNLKEKKHRYSGK
ncbi:putative transcriptional regulators [Candidatus Termititenax aidoneus]|uniref:Transcriptional regulators n=1 Tax=Termititenax aidoneus TaxID=2218524 RepID=A0A388T8C9_TERA1|nr:putative transcriptional regulators [Candidatus Termititenax aidoneus]